MKNNIVIATSRSGYEAIFNTMSRCLGFDIITFTCKEELSESMLREIDPRYVFFPHWSYTIPPQIYENYECIIFHMTDLPFGRGGSPLQNLIERGIYETRISALRCVKEVDAGPIYLKRPLSLYGNAEEIYLRTAKIIEEMIVEIVSEMNPPIAQEGEVTAFKRRTSKESDISKLDKVERIFDYIRMLDADGYPNAFIETEFLRLEFTRASLKDGEVLADVRIVRKNEK